MAIKVNREQFLASLECVEPGLSSREIVEQSSCFIFKDGTVSSFNDEISCSHEVGVKLQGAVTASPLLSILRKLVEEEIELSQENGHLLIKGKRKVTGIRMENEILSQIDSVDKPTQWRSLATDFAEAVGMVQHCAGKDQSKFWTTCIHIAPEWLEACDNTHLMRFRTVTGLKESVWVRRDSLRHICNLEMNEFSVTANWIHFRNAKGLVLSCRFEMIEDYPSLKTLLKGNGEPMKLPKGLIQAVEKAEIFSAENAGDDWVTVSLLPDRLIVKGEGAFGFHRETKTLRNYSGQPMKFLIRPSLLIDIVQKYSECQISETKLKVKGDKFTYISCLSLAKEKTND